MRHTLSAVMLRCRHAHGLSGVLLAFCKCAGRHAALVVCASGQRNKTKKCGTLCTQVMMVSPVANATGERKDMQGARLHIRSPHSKGPQTGTRITTATTALLLLLQPVTEAARLHAQAALNNSSSKLCRACSCSSSSGMPVLSWVQPGVRYALLHRQTRAAHAQDITCRFLHCAPAAKSTCVPLHAMQRTHAAVTESAN